MNSYPYAPLKGEVWADDKFLKLSSDARLLFIWSWSPPHATVNGLFEVTRRQMKRALGRTPAKGVREPGIDDRLDSAVAELEAASMWKYDVENEVLWVTNRVKHAPTTPRTQSKMRKEFRDLISDSPLLGEFVNRYGEGLQIAPRA